MVYGQLEQHLRDRIKRIRDYFSTGWRRRLLTLFFLLLSPTVIAILVVANWSTFQSYQVRSTWILIALALTGVMLLSSAYVWHRLVVHFTGYNDVGSNMRNWAYANLAKRLPTPVWYIGSRALLYEKHGISKTTTSFLSGLELVLVLVSGIATFFLTLPFWVLPEGVRERLGESWLLLVLLPLALLLVHPRLLEKLWKRLGQGTIHRQLLWRNTITWLFAYMAIWIIGAGILFSVINIFYPFPLREGISVIGMWAVTNIFSLAGTLTFTGVGVREISLSLFLARLLPLPLAILLAVTVRLVMLTGELVGALLSLDKTGRLFQKIRRWWHSSKV